MSLNSFRNGLGSVTSSPVGKWAIFIVGALLVFSLVFSGLGNNLGGRGASNGAAGASSETVATVNGDAITRAEFDQTTEGFRSQAQQMGQTIGVMKSGLLHATALDQLVTAKLELQQAKKLGLSVSDADLARQRQQIVTQSGIAVKLNLKPGATLREIDNALAQNGQPSIEDRLPDEALRQNALLDKLQTYQNNHITVTEADARQSFHQWHTRHILIDNKKRSDVQAQAQAQQVLAKAKAPGADFASLAKQYSEDPGSKDKGGDDDWIDQNTPYDEAFKTAAFALKPGDVTLAKSPQFGYFIIKLDAVRDNLPKDFDKNRVQYIAQATQQKQTLAQQKMVNDLKNDPNTKVVVNDPELRADRTATLAAKESDPVKRQTLLQSALTDYNAALKSNPAMPIAGEINAQIGQAYQTLQQPTQAITAFEKAVTQTDDADLRMALGSLYVQAKQPDKAVTQFEAASQQAWDNPQLHAQLASMYGVMHKPDLAKKEQDWMKQYQQRQQASMPPGMAGITPGAGTAPAPPPAAPSSPASPVRTVPGTGVQVVPGDAPGATTVLPAKKP